MDLSNYGLLGVQLLMHPQKFERLPLFGRPSGFPSFERQSGPPNQGKLYKARQFPVQENRATVSLIFMADELVHIEAQYGRSRKRDEEDLPHDLLPILETDFGRSEFARRGSAWLRTWECQGFVVMLGRMRKGVFLQFVDRDFFFLAARLNKQLTENDWRRHRPERNDDNSVPESITSSMSNGEQEVTVDDPINSVICQTCGVTNNIREHSANVAPICGPCGARLNH